MILIQNGERIGAYTVERFLGRGGFSYVYLAAHPTHGQVAVKVGDVAGGGKYVTRFSQATGERNQHWISPDEKPTEAIFFKGGKVRIDYTPMDVVDGLIEEERRKVRRANSYEQSLYPEILEEFEDAGRPATAMAYLEGPTLRELYRAEEEVDPSVFATIAESLQIVGPHEDLKPENVIVTPTGPRVIDPGLTMQLRYETLRTITPDFNWFLESGEKADVYGIGAMMYEQATGFVPDLTNPPPLRKKKKRIQFDDDRLRDVAWVFAGNESRSETFRLAHQFALAHMRPIGIRNNTPPELQDVIEACLTRYDSYGYRSLVRDLKAVAEGRPTTVAGLASYKEWL